MICILLSIDGISYGSLVWRSTLGALARWLVGSLARWLVGSESTVHLLSKFGGFLLRK